MFSSIFQTNVRTSIANVSGILNLRLKKFHKVFIVLTDFFIFFYFVTRFRCIFCLAFQTVLFVSSLRMFFLKTTISIAKHLSLNSMKSIPFFHLHWKKKRNLFKKRINNCLQRKRWILLKLHESQNIWMKFVMSKCWKVKLQRK